MLGNQDKDVNYDNLKQPIYYDFDLNGVSQDFDPKVLKKFCANKGYKSLLFFKNYFSNLDIMLLNTKIIPTV